MTQRFPTKEFQIELIRHDMTQKQIADYLSVHKSLISLVVNNWESTPWVFDFLMLILHEMQAGTFGRLEDYKCQRPD